MSAASYAVDAFLIVASICAIFLTIVFAFAGYALFKAAREVERFARRTRGQAERFINWERHMEKRAHFAGKWLRAFGTTLFAMKKE